MKSLSFLLLLLTLFTLSLSAQDIIIKHNSDTIKCTVTEMAADEIKYYYEKNPKLIFGIDKTLIDKVEFSTGEVIKVESDSFNNPEYYAKQAKHALKVKFLSPLMGYTEFGYEHSIKPGKSWEVALGIIGLGVDLDDLNASGVYSKFTYKFMRTPDYYTTRMHYSHILKGAYFAPEIALRYAAYDSYTYNNYGYYHDETERKTQFSGVLMLKLGKQWIIGDTFLLDIYVGVGYGFGGNDNDVLRYGFILGPPEFPIAATSGLRVGWVFGK